MEKRNEIRIINPDIKLLEKVKELAKINKRTVCRQAEFMLEWYIKKVKK